MPDIQIQIGATGANQVSGEFNEIENAASRAQNRLDDFGSLQGLDNFIGRLQSGKGELENLRGAMERVSGFGAQMAAVGGATLVGLATGIKSTLDAYGEMQQVEGGFETMLGSPSAAKAKIKEIQDFAANSPYDFMGGAKGAQGLLAVGVKAEDLIPIMKGVGNAVAAAGGDSETFQGLLTAIQQTKSEGKLTKENLNQITGRGIGVGFLAQKLGLTADQLANVGEQGIEADRAIKALTEGFAEVGGGKAMERQMETIPGQVSSLGDSFQQLKATVGEVFGKDASHLVQSLTGLLDKTKDFIAQHPQLAKTIAMITGAGALSAVTVGGGLMVGGAVARGAMDLHGLYKGFKNRKKKGDDDAEEEEGEEENELPKPKKKPKSKPKEKEEAKEDEGEEEEGPSGLSDAVGSFAGGKVGELAGSAANALTSKFLGEGAGEQVGDLVSGLAGDKVSEVVGGATDKALGKAGELAGKLFNRKRGKRGGGGDDHELEATAKSADKASEAKKRLVRATNDDIDAETKKAGVASTEASALDDVAESALGAANAKGELAKETEGAASKMGLLSRASALLKNPLALGGRGASALNTGGVLSKIPTLGSLGSDTGAITGGGALGSLGLGALAGYQSSKDMKGAGFTDGQSYMYGAATGIGSAAAAMFLPGGAVAVALGTGMAMAVDHFVNEPAEKAAEAGSGVDNADMYGADMQAKYEAANKAAKSGSPEGYKQMGALYGELSKKAKEAGDTAQAENFAAKATSYGNLARKANVEGTLEYDVASFRRGAQMRHDNGFDTRDVEAQVAEYRFARQKQGDRPASYDNSPYDLPSETGNEHRQATPYEQKQYEDFMLRRAGLQRPQVSTQAQGDVKVEVKVTRGDTAYDKDKGEYGRIRRAS